MHRDHQVDLGGMYHWIFIQFKFGIEHNQSLSSQHDCSIDILTSSMSLEKRLTMRPIGVVSKKDIVELHDKNRLISVTEQSSGCENVKIVLSKAFSPEDVVQELLVQPD